MRAFCLLLLIACSCKASTDFNSSGNKSGAVTSHYVIAGTADSAGVYVSSNQGVTWQQASIDLKGGQKIWGFAALDAELYCTSPGAGVFVSLDSGRTWTKTKYPGTTAQAITYFDKTLFVADNEKGIYASTDHGNSWVVRNLQLIGSYVRQFAASGTVLAAGTERKGIAISSNNGYSWDARDTQQIRTSDVHALAMNRSGIFAGASTPWLFLSTDKGLSWQSVSFANTTQNVWALQAADSMMFAGTSQGIYRSTNNGIAWLGNTPTMTDKDIHALAYDGLNLYAGTNGQGTYRSGDYGLTWTPINNGLKSFTVSAFITR